MDDDFWDDVGHVAEGKDPLLLGAHIGDVEDGVVLDEDDPRPAGLSLRVGGHPGRVEQLRLVLGVGGA